MRADVLRFEHVAQCAGGEGSLCPRAAISLARDVAADVRRRRCPGRIQFRLLTSAATPGQSEAVTGARPQRERNFAIAHLFGLRRGLAEQILNQRDGWARCSHRAAFASGLPTVRPKVARRKSQRLRFFNIRVHQHQHSVFAVGGDALQSEHGRIKRT